MKRKKIWNIQSVTWFVTHSLLEESVCVSHVEKVVVS